MLHSLHLVLQSARLYDAPRNHVRASYSQQAPVLDAAFQDDSHIFLAGLDGIVKRSCILTTPYSRSFCRLLQSAIGKCTSSSATDLKHAPHVSGIAEIYHGLISVDTGCPWVSKHVGTDEGKVLAGTTSLRGRRREWGSMGEACAAWSGCQSAGCSPQGPGTAQCAAGTPEYPR